MEGQRGKKDDREPRIKGDLERKRKLEAVGNSYETMKKRNLSET